MKSILKSVIKVAVSNVFTLLAGVFVSLFLPKLISTTDYANYKIFSLYTGYIGVIMLGFNDGIYLKYAGIPYDKLDRRKFRTFNLYLIIFSVIISAIAIVSSLFLEFDSSFIVLALALYLVPFNVLGYYQQISQITNRFNEYSITKIINSALSVLAVIVLFVLVKNNYSEYANYKTYTLCLIGINVLMAVWYLLIYKDLAFGERYSIRKAGKEITSLHKLGIPLLISNMITILFLNFDRQVVSMFYSKETYAMYAFAYNIMTLITTVISAVSIVLYPSLKRADEENRKTLYPSLVGTVIMVAFACMIFYFPLSWFIPWFLPNYTNSLAYLKVIFPSVVFNSAVNVITYNYFKISGKTKKFLFISTILLFVSLGLSVVGLVMNSLIFISFSTVISMLLWFLITDAYVSKAHGLPNRRIYCFIAVCLIMYYTSITIPVWWIGMSVYAVGIITGYGLILHKQFKPFLVGLIKRNNS